MSKRPNRPREPLQEWQRCLEAMKEHPELEPGLRTAAPKLDLASPSVEAASFLADEVLAQALTSSGIGPNGEVTKRGKELDDLLGRVKRFAN